MTKFVLISDLTLGSNYRDFPLLDFLPCAPSRAIPGSVYRFLKGPGLPASPDGQAKFAPYAIRKLQASLLRKYEAKDIAIAHENHLDQFIRDDTEIIGISTMDPLGIGPTTMSYYVLFGGDMRPWVREEWDTLINKVNALRRAKRR
ncbi:radical SAM domain protein, partial [mine drainage metagenome]